MNGAGEPPESVGSVAEETAKLLGALQDWAVQAGQEQVHGLRAAAAGLGATAAGVNAHTAHGQDCKYCPVCQAIGFIRSTSPEVKTHLAIAANSLLQAASAALAPNVGAPTQPGAASDGVEKISLSDEEF